MSLQFDNVMSHRLALVYAALAIRSAETPSAEYRAEIATRILQWSDEALTAEDVLGIVDDAVSSMLSDKGRELLAEAIREVGWAVDEEARRAFLYDLVHLALHDDWYMHEEGRFISAVARRWGVHPADDGRQRMWSVMEPGRATGDWTALHDLAFVYLALAHQADDDLSQEELDAIMKKVAEWLPAALPSDVVIIVSEALHVYAQGPDPVLLKHSVERIKKAVPAHQRAAIVADLEYVARADSVMLVEEMAIIAELAEAWDVELEKA